VPTWQAVALGTSVSMAEERCAMNCAGCPAQTRAGCRRQRKQRKIKFKHFPKRSEAFAGFFRGKFVKLDILDSLTIQITDRRHLPPFLNYGRYGTDGSNSEEKKRVRSTVCQPPLLITLEKSRFRLFFN
jgi:hypothetical protein